ncbi:hypothetical protein D3C71_2171530 [compost metagenome]
MLRHFEQNEFFLGEHQRLAAADFERFIAHRVTSGDTLTDPNIRRRTVPSAKMISRS